MRRIISEVRQGVQGDESSGISSCMRILHWQPLALLAASGLLAACATRVTPVQPPVVVIAPPGKPVLVPAQPGLSQKERLVRAIRLLETGDSPAARAELLAYLDKSPSSQLGRSLLQQIDASPFTLLGPVSFPHVAQPGESWSSLAERYLGDRYRFWGLARYNGVDRPSLLVDGTVVRIPGREQLQAQPARAPLTDEAEVDRRLAEEAEAVKKPEPPLPVPLSRPPADRGRAMALRRLGLENLQRGNVDVAIRQFAAAIDLALGTDLLGLLKLDLDKAVRIKRSLSR